MKSSKMGTYSTYICHKFQNERLLVQYLMPDVADVLKGHYTLKCVCKRKGETSMELNQ